MANTNCNRVNVSQDGFWVLNLDSRFYSLANIRLFIKLSNDLLIRRKVLANSSSYFLLKMSNKPFRPEASLTVFD